MRTEKEQLEGRGLRSTNSSKNSDDYCFLKIYVLWSNWFCVAFILFHLILKQPYQLDTDIVPIFQIKKLKLR